MHFIVEDWKDGRHGHAVLYRPVTYTSRAAVGWLNSRASGRAGGAFGGGPGREHRDIGRKAKDGRGRAKGTRLNGGLANGRPWPRKTPAPPMVYIPRRGKIHIRGHTAASGAPGPRRRALLLWVGSRPDPIDLCPRVPHFFREMGVVGRQEREARRPEALSRERSDVQESTLSTWSCEWRAVRDLNPRPSDP